MILLLQLFQPCPDVTLFRVAHKLLEPAHAGLVTNEQLKAAGIANDIGFFLLGLPHVKALSAERTWEQMPRVQAEVK